jgi:PAS domain S-box-containing protein
MTAPQGEALNEVESAGAPGPTMRLGADQSILACSPDLEQWWGRGPLTGQAFAELVDGVDRDRAGRLLRSAREFTTSGSLRLLAHDRSVRTVRVTGSPAPDTDGDGVALRLHVEVPQAAGPAGEHGSAPAPLRWQVSHLQAIADNLPAMVGYWTADLRCGFANSRIREWFGHEPDQVAGMHLSEFLGAELFARNLPFLQAALGGQAQSFERTLIKADGSTGHVWAQYIPDVVGHEIQGIHCLVSDVSELAQAKAVLRESQEMYRSLLHTMSSGFAHCQLVLEQGAITDCSYLEVNGAWETLLNQRDLIGRQFGAGWIDAAPQDGPLWSVLNRVAVAGQSERLELHVPLQSRWLGISVSRPREGFLFIVVDDISERKRAFERLSQVFASSPTAIGISRVADGRFVDVNDAFLRIYGYRRDELIGHTSTELKLWRDPVERDRVLSELGHQGQVRQLAAEIVTQSGQRGQVLASMTIIDLDGEPHLLGFLSDIGELEQARSALQQSELSYRALFHNMPSALLYGRVVLREETVVEVVAIETNDAFDQLTGWHPSEGRSVNERSSDHLLKLPEMRQRCARVALTEVPDRFELHVEALDAWLAVVIYSPQAEHVVAVMDNITVRKKAEAALQVAHARFECLINSNLVGVAIGDEQGGLRFSNDYYLRLLGATRAEMDAGLVRWDEFTVPEDHERDVQAFHQVRETGVSAPYEKECQLRDGSRTAIEIGLAQLPGDDGQLLAIVLDVSARRRARNELELANLALAERTREAEAASEAKTRFLSSVSHELRTPVHTMLGYASLMRRRSEGEARRHLEIIERSGMQLNRLIDDLLQFNVPNSHAANLLQRPVDLAALVQHVADLGHMLATPRRNHFQVSASPDLPAAVVMDEQRLLQVLQNLIGNACKFTSGGQIRFAIAHDAEAAASQPGGHCSLRFEVADNGSGIELEDQSRIFDAFQRGTSAQALPGLGLGLAIASYWVEAMGGVIALDSAPGQGSRFSFVLALRTAELPPRASSGAAETGTLPGPQRHVLVVDDIAANRAYLRDLCAHWGFKVTEASNGEDALAVCVDATQAVDAVLIDQLMPGMDGWDFLMALRHMPPSAGLPVALISASLPRRPPGLPDDVHFDITLGKPLDEQALHGFLGHCLRLHGLAPRASPSHTAPNHALGPESLPAEELGVLKELLDLGRLFAIEAWASALAKRDDAFATLAERVKQCCSNADLKALQDLLDAATRTTGKGPH